MDQSSSPSAVADATTATARSSRRRDDRGAVYPSPVVILSIVAVAMAAFAFVATRSPQPTEREITSTAAPSQVVKHHQAPIKASPAPKPKPKPKPVVRSDVMVSVFNNTNITGLAGSVSSRVSAAGWNVVGADNWVGTIPATTVYYPPQLAKAAKALALDLGVQRTMPSVAPMQMDRLTLILTGPVA